MTRESYIINGIKYDYIEERISKESAKILKDRFLSNGADRVLIKRDKASNSYNLYAKGKGKYWL